MLEEQKDTPDKLSHGYTKKINCPFSIILLSILYQ